MRTKYGKNAAALAALLWLAACGAKPMPLDPGERLVNPDPLAAEAAPALWIATSDYRTSGWLSRLDLASGRIERRLRATGADVELAPDGRARFFLLTRNGGDSLALVSGAGAEISATFPLADFSNPQFAARDSEGKVWVTSMESNSVDVLAPDLRARAGAVDLGALRDADGLAELYGAAPAADGSMAVIAARIERPQWVPSAHAAIAFVDSKTLQVKSSRELAIANAIQIFSTKDKQLAIVGAGAQDPSRPLNGGLELLRPASIAAQEIRSFTSRVIYAAMGADGTLATIDWRPEESRSCIRYGIRELVCDGHAPGEGNGFVFYRVFVVGGTVFAAYAKNGNSELWAIPVRGGAVQRITMDQPIVSLVGGP